jgi:hypothetical protein
MLALKFETVFKDWLLPEGEYVEVVYGVFRVGVRRPIKIILICVLEKLWLTMFTVKNKWFDICLEEFSTGCISSLKVSWVGLYVLS